MDHYYYFHVSLKVKVRKLQVCTPIAPLYNTIIIFHTVVWQKLKKINNEFRI